MAWEEGQLVVGFRFSIQRFSTWRFLFWISIQREGEQGKADRRGRGDPLWGLDTTASWTNLKLHYLKFHLQLPPKGVECGYDVGVDGVAVLCKSRAGAGTRGFVIVVVVVAWPLGFPASLSQALFINQIKFIWPPAAAPLSPHTHTPPQLCSFSAWVRQGGRKEGRRGRGRQLALDAVNCQLAEHFSTF